MPPAKALAQGRQALAEARDKMVDEEIVGAGIKNEAVIEAMRKTPRHEFVSLSQRRYAYLDMALPIGHGQTISPPFVVAYMTEQLDPQPSDKVLEIGTGSGYQAAVLSSLVRAVYTIEIVTPLGRAAAKTLKRLGYENVHTHIGDGFQGWPKHAPFDKIIVTCSPERVPRALAMQLKEGGRMVIPVGRRYQQILYLLKKTKGRLVVESTLPTLFVPMIGQAEKLRRVQPDPANPTLFNGDFEKFLEESQKPVGWHYQRQLKLVFGDEAPSGEHYVQFNNFEPGRGSQALQGFAVDGRKVKELEISLTVRGDNIRPGRSIHQLPMLVVTFFDDNRQPLGEAIMGPWRGSFPWQSEKQRIAVPVRSREAILRIGLLGAVGEICFDSIKLKPVDEE